MKEFNEWKEDTQKAIDYDTSFKFYFPLVHPEAIMLPESVELASTPEASAALQRLPASRRSVLVSMEQLKMPAKLNEKDDYRYKELSHPEIAAEIAKQGVALRNRMKQEEQDMRIYQHEAISIFFQALERNFPDKYGKHGTNAQLHHPTPTNRSSVPTFGHFGHRPDNLNRVSDPRRPPPPIPTSRGPNMASPNTPKSALFSAVGDKDTDMRDAPQAAPQAPQPQDTAVQISTASASVPGASTAPGVSRDPRKPPPVFNPYAMREGTSTFPPPNPSGRREEPLYSSNPYGRREEPLPPTGPLNPYGRREGREDLYSRRENIQPQRAVAYSNLFYSKQSPISPSLYTGSRLGQSPGSPASEHSAGHRSSIPMSRQGSGGSMKQSPVIGREGGGSRWDVSPRNNDIADGEAAYQRRKSMGMGGSLGR